MEKQKRNYTRTPRQFYDLESQTHRQLDTVQRDAWLGDKTLREDSTAERENCLGKDDGLRRGDSSSWTVEPERRPWYADLKSGSLSYLVWNKADICFAAWNGRASCWIYILFQTEHPGDFTEGDQICFSLMQMFY